MSADVELGLETGAPSRGTRRHCRRCDVEINAASARCPYCGARQLRRQPILGWRGAIVCLVLVAAAVDRDAAGGRVASVADDLQLLPQRRPRGARPRRVPRPLPRFTARHGTVGFASRAHPGDREMVRATVPAAGTPARALDGLYKLLRKTPGVASGSAGSRRSSSRAGSVPELLYTKFGDDYAVFGFDACSHTIAVR